MWEKLAEVHKPARVMIELFLLKKLYNFHYTDNNSMEGFFRQHFDFRDQCIDTLSKKNRNLELTRQRAPTKHADKIR